MFLWHNGREMKQWSTSASGRLQMWMGDEPHVDSVPSDWQEWFPLEQHTDSIAHSALDIRVAQSYWW